MGRVHGATYGRQGSGHEGMVLLYTPDGDEFWMPEGADHNVYLRKGFSLEPVTPLERVERDTPRPCLRPVLRDGMWTGRRAFIIGGGPSVRTFDWSRLDGELSIAVNRAFEFCDPSIVFSMDDRWYRWTQNGRMGEPAANRYASTSAVRVMLDAEDKHEYPDFVFEVGEYPGGNTLSPKLAYGLAHGSNSGEAALNLALCLGADPIYLVGFDMKGSTPDGNVKHFHSGYPTVPRDSKHRLYLANFQRIAQAANARATIINVNPDSALDCFEFGELPDDKPTYRPLVVSFFTKDSGYEREAEEMWLTAEEFGFETDIEGVDDLGGWDANTRQKAAFLRRKMDQHPGRDLLWLDADARIRKAPTLFDNFWADLGAHWRDHARFGRGDRLELLTGTMFLRNNAPMRELLDAWVYANALPENAHLWEQRVLQDLLDGAWGDRLHIVNLPPTYCQIFDTMAGAGEPVIEQMQASRELKQEVAI